MNADLLVYQAKAFYNAYIALDQLSRDDSDTLLLLFAPLVVNGAFSVELALKAILAKNQIEYGKEHNLLILFQMLPKSFQQELWAYLIEKAPEYAGSEKGLDELILLSNAFVDWRYAFEGKPVPAIESRFLAAFANAAVHTTTSSAPCSGKSETRTTYGIWTQFPPMTPMPVTSPWTKRAK